MRYIKEEDKIILRNLKSCSRKGAPLNICAALMDAQKEIRLTLRRRRTPQSVRMRWYNYLRHHHEVWTFGNMKVRRMGLEPLVVMVGKRKFTLDANLKPLIIQHLNKIAK